ncbi:hypothetical protein IWW48_003739 [Coemansia sp. RSA 1200]|nr:hypothetical protein IWW48_003739 [Coemansia sp. RSA 1200]
MKLIYMVPGLVGLFGAVNAGISVTKPCPRFSNAEWCPPIPDGVQADANMNTPVTNINSQGMFEMCRHKQEWPVPVANWTAGQPVTIEFEVEKNTATGGYCQFSISYDGQNFAVIDEVLGDCFFQVNNTDAAQVASQTFNLPDSIPGSEYAIFAWTWLSPGPQGDFYMNCADVNITNANNSTSYSGKQMVIANAPGYPGLIDISANQAAIQSQYTDASLIPITPNLGARKRHVSSKTGEDCGDPNRTSDDEDGSSSDSDNEGSGGNHGKEGKGAFGESDGGSQATEAANYYNEGKYNGGAYASSYYSSGGYVVGTDSVTTSSGFSTGSMDSYTGDVYNNQQQYQQQQQQQEEDCEEDTNYETDCEEEIKGNGQSVNNNIGNSNGESQGCSCNGQNSSPFASAFTSGSSGSTSTSSNFNNMMMMMIMKFMQNSMTPNYQMYGGAINPYMGFGMYGSNMYGSNMLGNTMYGNGMYGNSMLGNGMYGNNMYGNGMYGSNMYSNGMYSNGMYGNNMNNMNGNMNGYMGGGSNTNTDSNISINLDLNGNYNQGNYGQGGYSQGGYNQNGNNQNRYGQNGNNQNDYNQNRYSQNDYNQNRYGQNDYSQGRYSQNNYNQDRYGQNDYNKGRYSQGGYGQNYDQNNGYAKDLGNNYSDLASSQIAPTSSESLRYETIVSLGYVTKTVYSDVMITEEIAVTEYITETSTSIGYLIAPTSVAPQANILDPYRRVSKPVTVLENGAAQPANFQYVNPANS